MNGRLLENLGIALALLVLLWGWVVLGIAGGICFATAPWAKRSTRRAAIAICALVMAVCWARLVQPMTFGVLHQTIRTQSGETEAALWERSRYYELVVRRDGMKRSVPLPRGRMVGIFWIQEGKTIGVEYEDCHYIVDVEILADTAIHSRRLSPEEEARRLNPVRRLNPGEEEAFEAARRAAAGQ